MSLYEDYAVSLYAGDAVSLYAGDAVSHPPRGVGAKLKENGTKRFFCFGLADSFFEAS